MRIAGSGVARGHSMEGEILPGGADFQLVTSATYAQLDARYILLLQDGSQHTPWGAAHEATSNTSGGNLSRGSPEAQAAARAEGQAGTMLHD